MEDREGVGRVIGRRDQPVILVILEHRRIAVAGEDIGMDIVGQQRPPTHVRRRMIELLGKDVRHARAEVVGKLAVEGREILLRAGRHEIDFLALVRCLHGDAKAFVLLARVDLEAQAHRRADRQATRF